MQNKPSPPPTLSAIIPTLNEEGAITGAIESLKSHTDFIEITVADGGSTDATCRLAEAAGARVIHCDKKGRGIQVAEAWEICSGDVLVVLHADVRFPPHGGKAICRALAHNKTPGGAFSMAFTPATNKTRVIALLNRLRSNFLGISFGDQCQFVRRTVLDGAGGFPAMKLMEDVELSLIMKRSGRPVTLPETVSVSSRRWGKIPFSQGVGRVLFLFFTYLASQALGHPPGDGTWYHDRYYK